MERRVAQKEGVKVASIKDQNPFYLLKEESKNKQSIQYYQLAGYDQCIAACLTSGNCFSYDDCRSLCK